MCHHGDLGTVTSHPPDEQTTERQPPSQLTRGRARLALGLLPARDGSQKGQSSRAQARRRGNVARLRNAIHPRAGHPATRQTADDDGQPVGEGNQGPTLPREKLTPVDRAPILAHFHDGPLHDQWRHLPPSAGRIWRVPRPEPLTCTLGTLDEISPTALAPVTGHYRHTPWTDDPHRWDWQGWDDEPLHVPGIDGRITPRHAPAPTLTDDADDWPDAMRWTPDDADAELEAWNTILHPQ